ncbi:hypothetical protein [Pueribacillus sp. YX66]|uniref:hypothetical protein n=1 Tax=Pueribacillus sp. YX66 TaxID=3229242 RepID=UPI00358D9E27
MNLMFGNESLRTLLSRLLRSGTLINEVVLQDSDLTLMGVTVQSVQGQYVTFTDQASPGIGQMHVAIDKIVAIEV